MIQLHEWLAEVERLSHGDEGVTAHELAQHMGKGIRAVQRLLRQGVVEGRYTPGWSVRRDITGRNQRVPVYRIQEVQRGRKVKTQGAKRRA